MAELAVQLQRLLLAESHLRQPDHRTSARFSPSRAITASGPARGGERHLQPGVRSVARRNGCVSPCFAKTPAGKRRHQTAAATHRCPKNCGRPRVFVPVRVIWVLEGPAVFLAGAGARSAGMPAFIHSWTWRALKPTRSANSDRLTIGIGYEVGPNYSGQLSERTASLCTRNYAGCLEGPPRTHATSGRTAIAIAVSDGSLRWQLRLPAQPVGGGTRFRRAEETKRMRPYRPIYG